MGEIETVGNGIAGEDPFLSGLVGVIAGDSIAHQVLKFEFADDVAQAQVQISGQSVSSSSGVASFGSWLALGAGGEVIASGLLLEPLGTLSGNALTFNLNIGQAFTGLVISSVQDQSALAAGYSADFDSLGVQLISTGGQNLADSSQMGSGDGGLEVRVTALTLEAPDAGQEVVAATQEAAALASVETVNSLAAAEDSVAYVRPFAENAPWNVAVEGLSRHADSDFYTNLLWNDAPDRAGNFNVGNDGYTYPVYEVQADTPWYPVSATTNWGNLDGEDIPFDPAWLPAAGTDGQIIILDPATGREWDLWQVNFDGSTVNISNGSLTNGDYRSNDYLEPEDWTPGSRGVGIPYLAMLVRPEEVAQGAIEHALSMPVRNTSGEEYLPPATKLEFPNHGPGIPEGMRFALDVTDAEIDAWVAGLPAESQQAARVIAVAMRDYGWFITDTAGGATIQLEDVTTAGAEWDALGLGNPRDLLDGLMQPDRIFALVSSDQYPTVEPVPEPEPEVNSAPQVVDISLAGDEDADIAFSAADFQAAFSDADAGDTLQAIQVMDLPKHGTLQFDGASVGAGSVIVAADIGKLSFSPDANWHGDTGFAWRGFDGSAYSVASASVSLTITTVNDAPVAMNDSGYVSDDGAAIVISASGLANNDLDPDGDVLFVSAVGDAVNGIVLLSVDPEATTGQLPNDTTITFVPDAGFSGTAGFEYFVADGQGGSDRARVEVEVKAAEEAPTDPLPVTVTSLAGSLTGTVGNQMWGGIHVAAQRWDGEDGKLSFKAGRGIGIKGGRRGNQIDFSVRDEDGDGVAGDSEKLILTFPEAVAQLSIRLDRMSASESGGHREVGKWQALDANGILVAVGLLDPEAGTMISGRVYDFEIDAGGAFSQLVISATGYDNLVDPSFTGNNSEFSLNQVTYTPAADQGLLAPDSSPEMPLVGDEMVNHVPLAIDDGVYSGWSNEPLHIVLGDLLGNDSDVDLDLLMMTSVGGAAHGSVGLVDGAVVFVPTSGYSGGASFTYEISDGNGGRDSANVELIINDRPEPVALSSIRDALSSGEGGQFWGEVRVSAESWSGDAAKVGQSKGGLAVQGGRDSKQIDFSIEDKDGDGVGGDSETLMLEFPGAVTHVSLQLAAMNDSELGGYREMGAWTALDDQGAVIATGVFDPATAESIGPNTWAFVIDVEQSLAKLLLSASDYFGGAAEGFTRNNSDFMVSALSYVPAATGEVAPMSVENVGPATDALPTFLTDIGRDYLASLDQDEAAAVA